MGLFDDQEPATRQEAATGEGTPLAERMRPRGLDELVGQQQVLGEDGFLRRAIAEDRVPSMVLWGPPGCGKTTLAKIVAQSTSCRFVPFSAVTSGIKEVKQVMADAARFRKADGRRTLLFVDEIHRFNRAQQDAFLPYVEAGDIVLVGATTENPSFEIVGALLSRCRVVVLEALDEDSLRRLLRRALEDEERGLGTSGVTLDAEAEDAVLRLAAGDARRALNLLEQAVEDAVSADRDEIAAEHVEAIAQRRILLYDKSGEEHFNLISALHKSLRASDAQAAIYWLLRMLESGEQPEYIARRMARFAVEDVGLADPNALRRALDAWEAYERLGSPEGDLALVQAAIYLALAPKSDAAYQSLKAVKRALTDEPLASVPAHLRNAPTKLMKDLGYGEGYDHAHEHDDGVGRMECLPDVLAGTRFYRPTERGVEKRFKARLKELEQIRSRAYEN